MGHAFISPLRRWDVIAGLCQAIDARTFVEVGCKEGRVTGHVLQECPQIRVVAIDPWKTQPKSDDPLRETYENWDFAEIERVFWENVGANKERCTMVRETSEFASDNIRRYSFDAPFDVIFIDAMHDYASVRQDVELWWPKVREGGFLVLYDYNHKWPSVMRAVADSFNLMDVRLAADSIAFVQKRAEMREAA